MRDDFMKQRGLKMQQV